MQKQQRKKLELVFYQADPGIRKFTFQYLHLWLFFFASSIRKILDKQVEIRQFTDLSTSIPLKTQL